MKTFEQIYKLEKEIFLSNRVSVALKPLVKYLTVEKPVSLAVSELDRKFLK